MSHMVLPLGWMASTNFYQLLDESFTLNRRPLGPSRREWGAADTSRQYTFDEASALGESLIRNRPGRNVSWGEFRLYRRAGNRSINQENAEVEGIAV